MFAHGDAGFHFVAAHRAIHGGLWHVRPLAFEPHRRRGATVHVRNFAIRMFARPSYFGRLPVPHGQPPEAARIGEQQKAERQLPGGSAALGEVYRCTNEA